MRISLFATAAASVFLMTACDRPAPGEPEDQPEPPLEQEAETALSQTEQRAAFEKLAAENLAASKAFLDENAARNGVSVTDSGLQYMVLEEGPDAGATPVSTDLVVVHYVGTLKDGVEFDSSRARGAAATFRLNQVIPGWTEGVQLMSEGDKFRFFVPPDLAYRDRGAGPVIGPNEALIFDVELIKVQNPERNLEAANAFLAGNAKKEGVNTTDSGLQYQVIAEGPADGKSPSADDTVEVHYQGTLINGTEFDSSYERGETIKFPLNGVIPGWTEGVQLMSEGDKFRFFIPPALAYGERGTPGGPIGPNEALIFEVELVSVD
ncbi:MAG: FKBP-type peptidyl-prolyl cis-trans isomerase [Hyphococcus sp.]